MPTLLVRLAGPQSWSTSPPMRRREAGHEPSKCGVMGLACSAMGIDRADVTGLSQLTALRMGVRVDHVHPVNGYDYVTAGAGLFAGEPYGVLKANGKVGRPGDPGGHVEIFHKYFMQDAFFLVGLEGDEAVLAKLRDALRRPRWGVSLGRKCFKPTMPLVAGLLAEPLERALEGHVWLLDEIPIDRCRWRDRARDRASRGVRIVVEVPLPPFSSGHGLRTVFDVPRTFADRNAERAPRVVQRGLVVPAGLRGTNERGVTCAST